ncbi:MAG: LacI family DNA-binding transcriptional regulator [Ignavibacteriaceae bacterium]
MKQVTIKNIASTLNLSVSTVSRALNDHPDIHTKTKRLVKKAAVELGYNPNIIARSLKSSRSNQIGVIVPEIRHDFFANAISGIEEVAYQKGYTIIIAQSNEQQEREVINLNSMYLHRVAGIIVSISQTTTSSSHFKRLIERGVKMVFFDRVCDDLDTPNGYNLANELLKNGINSCAIFAVNDPVAVGAVKRLKESHIEIPGQIGIVGFSNNPITEMISPALSTVDQHSFEMGRKAAEILIDQIEGGKYPSSELDIKLETKLILREST